MVEAVGSNPTRSTPASTRRSSPSWNRVLVHLPHLHLLRVADPCGTHRRANRPLRSEVAALSDLVGFANPSGKLFVELVGRGNAKMVHKQSLRVRIGSPYAWIAHPELEIRVPTERSIRRLNACEPAAGSFECNRRLRHR